MNPYAILGHNQQDSLRRGGLSALASIRIPVKNDTGSDIAAKKLVYFSGYDAAAKRYEIALADADDPAKRAAAITDHAIKNGVSSYVVLEALIGGADTSGTSVGDAIYESATAGAFTKDAPTGADQEKLVVGRVKAVSASVGVVHFSFPLARLEKVGSSFLQSGAVVAAALGTSSVTTAKIASLNVTAAKLGVSSVTNTKIGSLAVTAGKIGVSAVTNAKIGSLAVTAGKIGASAVTTAKIASLAVTKGKLSNSLLVGTGTGVMASGSLVVAAGYITKGDTFQISAAQVSTPSAPGAIYVNAITSLTSFHLKSTSGTDASKVRYSVWKLA